MRFAIICRNPLNINNIRNNIRFITRLAHISHSYFPTKQNTTLQRKVYTWQTKKFSARHEEPYFL